MLKVTYEQLRNPNFASGMSKLVNYSAFPVVIGCKVAKINKACMSEAKIADELFRKLIDKHAEKTPDGSLKPREGTEGTWWIAVENQPAWGKDVEEFLSHAVDVHCSPIPQASLDGVGLTPLEIGALDSFLVSLAAVD